MFTRFAGSYIHFTFLYMSIVEFRIFFKFMVTMRPDKDYFRKGIVYTEKQSLSFSSKLTAARNGRGAKG